MLLIGVRLKFDKYVIRSEAKLKGQHFADKSLSSAIINSPQISPYIQKNVYT